MCESGYQVEKRRPGGSWEKATPFPVTEENVRIPDLDEGQEYEFRVAAITDAGLGDFSLNTAPTKICEKKGRKVDSYSTSYLLEPLRILLLDHVLNGLLMRARAIRVRPIVLLLF